MRAWVPLAWFGALATVLTVVVVALVRPPGPLDQPDRAEVRVVVPREPTDPVPVPAVVDPQGRLAQAVDLPTPVDGGRPVGYAVVDADRTVRCSTLDPEYLRNAFEVATIAGAVP